MTSMLWNSGVINILINTVYINLIIICYDAILWCIYTNYINIIISFRDSDESEKSGPEVRKLFFFFQAQLS